MLKSSPVIIDNDKDNDENCFDLVEWGKCFELFGKTAGSFPTSSLQPLLFKQNFSQLNLFFFTLKRPRSKF